MNAPTPAKALAPATPATLQATAHLVQLIPLGQISPSPTNPRKRIDQAKLEELAATIREQGVLEPILVREALTTIADLEKDLQRYELVAGERRWRASQLAGFADIPAMVRDLSDEAVLLIQVIENNQREDVHPLEEAEGYQRLMDKPHNMTADAIAGKIGRSRRYVFNRLKLLDLIEPVRDAMYAGKVDTSIAHLIARLPQSLHAKALEDITEDGDVAMTVRETAAYLERNFMLRLDAAPFDIKITNYCAPDQLQPIAGACGTCPKRTGANPDLFGDASSADLCTDGDCFKAKCEAHRQRTIDAARKNGITIIDGEAAEKLMGHRWMDSPEGYTRVDSVLDEDADPGTPGAKTYREALGKDAKARGLALFIDPNDNEIYEVIPDKTAQSVLKKSGLFQDNDGPGSASANNDRAAAAQKEREAREAQHRKDLAGRTAVFRAVREQMHAEIDAHQGIPTLDDVRDIALKLCNSDYEMRESLVDLYGLAGKRDAQGEEMDDDEIIAEHIASLGAADLFKIMFDATIADVKEQTFWNDPLRDPLHRAAERLGIDQAAIVSAATATSKPTK